MAFADGTNGKLSPRRITVADSEAMAALEQSWLQYKEGLQLRKKGRGSAGAKLLSRHLSFAESPTSAFSFSFDSPTPVVPSWKACILSIDGGATRSAVPARVLCYLEQTLQKKVGNPDARIADFFDIFAGTNVGGLLAAMLCTDGGDGRPLFSAEQASKVIAEECEGYNAKLLRQRVRLSASLCGLLSLCKSRRRRRSFSTADIERVLKQHLTRSGRRLTLRDTIRPLLIPCYDMSSAGAFLFSRADAMRCDSFNFTLEDVCRATTAVPGVVEPAQMSSVDGKTTVLGVDGALVMGNPAAMAMTHVLHNTAEFPHVREVGDTIVLSIGTGLMQDAQGYGLDEVKRWGPSEWAHPLARIVLDGMSDMVDQFMSMAFHDHRKNYIRIQVSAGGVSRGKEEKGAAADVLEQPCMERIPFGGNRQLPVTNRQRLDWFADCLVAEHRSRAPQQPAFF